MFHGDGQYLGDGGLPLERLWRLTIWDELRNCPGRYTTRSKDLKLTPAEIIAQKFSPGCPVEHFRVPGKDDVVVCRFHGGGGLMTYIKAADPRAVYFIHTLNTESGLLRKIDATGIPLTVNALSSPHFPAILHLLPFLSDAEKNASAYCLVRRLGRERADPSVVTAVVRTIVAAVSEDSSRWPFRSEKGDLLRALEATNRPELNEVLKSLAAHGISPLGTEEAPRDMLTAAFRVVRGPARERLFSFMCNQRLFDLDVWSRCLVLHVAQMLRMDHVPAWVVPKVMTSTTRGRLVRLKAEIDGKGNYHSLHKLVFQDVKSDDDRRSILQHFYVEAKVRRACTVFAERGEGGAIRAVGVTSASLLR